MYDVYVNVSVHVSLFLYACASFPRALCTPAIATDGNVNDNAEEAVELLSRTKQTAARYGSEASDESENGD